jgi:hypothetical protein
MFRENILKALSIGNAYILMELRRRAVKFPQVNDNGIKFSARDRNA